MINKYRQSRNVHTHVDIEYKYIFIQNVWMQNNNKSQVHWFVNKVAYEKKKKTKNRNANVIGSSVYFKMLPRSFRTDVFERQLQIAKSTIYILYVYANVYKMVHILLTSSIKFELHLFGLNEMCNRIDNRSKKLISCKMYTFVWLQQNQRQ